MAHQLINSQAEETIVTDAVRTQKTLLGFVLESEPMPDDEREILYTLTHPDLPGLAYSGTDAWETLIAGVQAAGRMLQDRMEAGQKLTIEPI